MCDESNDLLDTYVRRAKSIRLSAAGKQAILDAVREAERGASHPAAIADARGRKTDRPAPTRRVPDKTLAAHPSLPHPVPKRRFASVCAAALLCCVLLAAGAVLAPWGGGAHDMSPVGPFLADANVAKRPAMRLEVFDVGCLETSGADMPEGHLPDCTIEAKLVVPFLSGQLRAHLEGADTVTLLPSDATHWPTLMESPQKWVIINRADGYHMALAKPPRVSQSELDRYREQGLDQSFAAATAADIVEQLEKARLVVRDDANEYLFSFLLPDAADSATLRHNVTVANEYLPLSLELELLKTFKIEN